MGKLSAERVILISVRPCIRQLSRRSRLSAKDIRKSMASLHSRLGNLKKGFYIIVFIHKRQIHRSSRIYSHHHMAVQRTYIFQLLFFHICKEIVSRSAETVRPLSRNTAENINRRFRVCLFYSAAFRHYERRRGINVKEVSFAAAFLYFLQDPVSPVLSCLRIAEIIIMDPFLCSDHISRIFHALIDAHAFPFIHIPGSGSPFYGHRSSGAIQRHFCSRFQGQKMSFIFKKDHAFRCSFLRKPSVHCLPESDGLIPGSGKISFSHSLHSGIPPLTNNPILLPGLVPHNSDIAESFRSFL